MIRFHTAASPLALALLLAGCAVGPTFKTPPAPTAKDYTPAPVAPEIPATATTPGQQLVNGGAVSSLWWTQFGSEALNQLVAMALAKNTDIAVADATLRQARSQASAEVGGLLPEVDAGYQAERTRVSKALSDPLADPGVYRYSLHTASLTVSYPLDLFGGVRRKVESARATAEATAFRLQAARLTVVSNVVVAAITEAALRKKIAATEEGLKAAREALALLRVQLSLGAIGKADVAAQVTVVAQAEAALPALQKDLVAQQTSLSILLGRDPHEPLPASVDLDTLTLPANLPVSLPSDLVRQRPDVRASEAALHAASADVGVAIAARLPSIALSGSVGGQAVAFGDMFRDGNPFWTLIGGITQPLFHGGALRAQQRSAEAALDIAKAQYRAAVLGAFGDVANALTALDADRRSLAAAETAASSARENYGYLDVQLRLGQVGSLALLNATAARIETANALVDARVARIADVAALYQALGGGTTR
ncbi:efflux transporter outer membrane subunit [Sphingomonas sp. AP4-R1]|uniref:efflux transporter outer membrane subunit n=1 Tax=Sphingomonas sp. AP4-R1 TaxID=2735134 RepID=UPI001493A19A|nr:efflux transporter outer membrane subunit [Sphingomonas sp. AP4-R1]QJU59090.1 efflux transporter outer membrane subunit [Sphingomonas sp. AP4-R1]